MIVSDLIELLQKCPPDSEVETEGCDCFGAAVDVDDQGDGTVVITRNLVNRTKPVVKEPEKTGIPPSKEWAV